MVHLQLSRMSFKPNDANTLLESILLDLHKTLKKRNVKTPGVTIEKIQEHLELCNLVLKRTVTGKRKRGCKTKAKKKTKTGEKGETDEASLPEKDRPLNVPA